MKNELNLIQKGILLSLFLFCSFLSSQENDNLYASAEDVNMLVLEPSYTSSRTNKTFEKKFHYLVARAYFKLLAEAQKSERKLRIEFERYSFENEEFDRAGNQVFQDKFNLAFKKYKAHSDMLSGLKSWNLFSEDRTGDMFYFMAENEDFIFKMYKGKLPEDKMVRYLIYKLADLYHLEG
ncbi:hypothetical protein FEE95_06545 [Maribacter algarum]|uniref:Uncharacterized protein n=1 Tax=Maribacter algarum (ex Zhang et al. 2020) TaxID=2578118 RepID=A0A5S3Q0H8_9FLAO|nr:hypothetical protein [Maribacter algarum]TMM59087.1 hypothetical protein FEE95_06545 [Maribacter algarum]